EVGAGIPAVVLQRVGGAGIHQAHPHVGATDIRGKQWRGPVVRAGADGHVAGACSHGDSWRARGGLPGAGVSVDAVTTMSSTSSTPRAVAARFGTHAE